MELNKDIVKNHRIARVVAHRAGFYCQDGKGGVWLTVEKDADDIVIDCFSEPRLSKRFAKLLANAILEMCD